MSLEELTPLDLTNPESETCLQPQPHPGNKINPLLLLAPVLEGRTQETTKLSFLSDRRYK